MTDPIVIAGAARTPMGGMLGDFAALRAHELGAAALKAAIDGAGLDKGVVEEVLMGNVLGAGQGQAPARQAAFGAGLGEEVPAVTLNKMCGSGMRTVMMAYDQLLAGGEGAIAAGGMESMTNAPYLLPKMRGGARFGHTEVFDHMKLDGLEDAYEPGRAMGEFAEECAEAFQFSRAAQDEYAVESLNRSLAAQKSGAFAAEIAPVTVKTRKGEVVVAEDEQPGKADPSKIPGLRPAFKKDGTVTAATSASISDGAAALVLMRESEAKAKGARIRAYIRAHGTAAQKPSLFTTAPIPAMKKALAKAGWSPSDVDLWEINEAFAVVPMAAMTELGVPRDRLNVNGGACALGHPIGASGARILVTLLHAMEAADRDRLRQTGRGPCVWRWPKRRRSSRRPRRVWRRGASRDRRIPRSGDASFGPRDLIIECRIGGGGRAPADLLPHTVFLEPGPDTGRLEQGDRVDERAGKGVGRRRVKLEARGDPGAECHGRGRDHGVDQPACIGDDGDGAVAEAVELGETAGLEPRRHDDRVAAGDDPVGFGLVIADMDSDDSGCSAAAAR